MMVKKMHISNSYLSLLGIAVVIVLIRFLSMFAYYLLVFEVIMFAYK